MQTRRKLKDSNISVDKRQISFISLGALQGGSASAILANWRPDGPPSDITIENWWKALDTIFGPEESNFDRDNRFKRFKLGDFPSVLHRTWSVIKTRWLNARFHLLRISRRDG